MPRSRLAAVRIAFFAAEGSPCAAASSAARDAIVVARSLPSIKPASLIAPFFACSQQASSGISRDLGGGAQFLDFDLVHAQRGAGFFEEFDLGLEAVDRFAMKFVGG